MSDKVYVGNKLADIEIKGEFLPYSKVILTLDSETAYIAGDDTGRTLTASCPWATQAMANAILSQIQGFVYNPFEGSQAILDPAAELGDGCSAGTVYAPLSKIQTTLDALCAADIGATADEEIDHEYPYKSQVQQQVEYQLRQVKASLIVDIDSITQQITGINGELTQITADITGITQQVQDAQGNISTLQQTATSLQSQITATNGAVSTISQKVDSIDLSVSNGYSSSSIQLTVGGVLVSSQTIRFTGDVVFESDLASGTTTVSGDCITTGQVSADYIKLGGKMEVYQSTGGNSSGGYIGYMSGMTASGSITAGIAITDSTQKAIIICTNAGARMGYNGVSTVVCSATQVGITGNTVYINGEPATTSDRRAKTEISNNVSDYLPIFDRLSPVTFRYNSGNRRHLGLIAQDVEQILTDVGMDSQNFGALCYEPPCTEYPDGQYSLRYGEFIPLLIAKVQQLEKEIKAWTTT